MISDNLKLRIKGYLEGFIQGLIDEFKPPSGINPKDLRPTQTKSKKGFIKPFHEAIIPDGILRISEFERSFSTKLGTSFEEVAKLIALENHEDSVRQYRLQGKISFEAIKMIESIKNETNHGGFKTKDYIEYIEDVINVLDGEGETRQVIADLYILTEEGNEILFEIKSPKPNKGQCLEATERLLEFHALKGESFPSVQTYYAMAYNPYGIEKSDYNHSFTKNYLDLYNQVLIGEEFWQIIGKDQKTYFDVIKIYKEIGKEKGPEMIDKLALGY